MQLIPLLLLLLFVPTEARTGPTMVPERVIEYHEIACGYTGGICPPAPEVIAVDTRPGLWGYHYRGSSTVFLSTKCMMMNDWCKAVLVHEMVHYIVSEQRRMVDRCVNEQFAWAIFNRYLIEIGRLDITNSGWRKAYRYC